MAVEQEMQGLPGLDYIIIRPALVYGPGDRAGLSKSICYHSKSLQSNFMHPSNGECQLNVDSHL